MNDFNEVIQWNIDLVRFVEKPKISITRRSQQVGLGKLHVVFYPGNMWFQEDNATPDVAKKAI